MTKQPQEDTVSKTPSTSFSGDEVNAEQLNTVQTALEEANTRAEDNWQKLLRKEAELQNIRKRAEQDVANARKYSIDRFAESLLVVIDSFEQGLQVEQPKSEESARLVEGMDLTYKALLDVLDKFGVSPINPAQEAFNPLFHEAISMFETSDVPPNQVVTVVQKGYMVHDRVLRPARVVVAKASAS